MEEINKLIESSDPNAVTASLLIQMNGFLDENTVKQLTGLSRQERWRMRDEGSFPDMVTIRGKRKAYRAQDIQNWLKNPADWRNEKN